MTKDTIGVDISKDHLDAHRMTARSVALPTTQSATKLSWVGSVKPRPSMTCASSTNRQAPITGPSSGSNPVLRGYEPRGYQLPCLLKVETLRQD